MKTVLVFFTFLACAFGLQIQDGSLVDAEFENGRPGVASVIDASSEDSPSCIGSATIFTVDNGNQVEHVKLNQEESDDIPARIRRLKYKSTLSRGMTKIVETQGNCCWEFFSR